MIDSHVHFWHYQASDFPWIDAGMGVLQQDFLPEHFFQNQNNIDAAIAVQARCHWDENHYLLALAAQEPRLQAVVGWFDFDADIAAQLDLAQSMPLLKGFRHLIQDESDPSAYLNHHQGLNQALPRLQAASKVYEVLVHQQDLAAALTFCQRHDQHYLVMDHLGKPRFGAGADFAHWRHHIEQLAALPHVIVKMSGLETEAGVGCTAADFQAHIDVLQQSFGAQRLMWGSNWPVCQLTHRYDQLLEHLAQLTHTWSDSERWALTGGTASHIYQLHSPSNQPHLSQRTCNGFATEK